MSSNTILMYWRVRKCFVQVCWWNFSCPIFPPKGGNRDSSPKSTGFLKISSQRHHGMPRRSSCSASEALASSCQSLLLPVGRWVLSNEAVTCWSPARFGARKPGRAPCFAPLVWRSPQLGHVLQAASSFQQGFPQGLQRSHSMSPCSTWLISPQEAN